MKRIEIHTKFALNHNDTITTYEKCICDVEDDVWEHFYVKYHANLLEDLTPVEIVPEPILESPTIVVEEQAVPEVSKPTAPKKAAFKPKPGAK